MKTWADYLKALKAAAKRRNKEIEAVVLAEITLPQGTMPKGWEFLKGNFPPSEILLEVSKARQAVFEKMMARVK